MQSESMNAIDVAYQTEVAIENKSTEQLTAEVNVKYHQAEMLAKQSWILLADAGRRLIEIKNRIPHGQFLDWCENNLEFSHSKAARMMKLASEIDAENGLFSKLETWPTIGISTVLALLEAPEDVASEVIENNDIENMKVRELKEEIARIKEEKQEAERAAMMAENSNNDIRKELARVQRELADAVTEEDYSRMQNEYVEAQKDLENELREAKDASAEIQAKLDKAKADLKKAKEKLKESEIAKDEEVQKSIEEAKTDIVKKAKDEAHAEFVADLEQNAKDIKQLQEEIERLEAEKAKLSNTRIMTFKVLTDQLQDVLAKIADIIEEQNDEDPDVGTKMTTGLKAIAERWIP